MFVRRAVALSLFTTALALCCTTPCAAQDYAPSEPVLGHDEDYWAGFCQDLDATGTPHAAAWRRTSRGRRPSRPPGR